MSESLVPRTGEGLNPSLAKKLACSVSFFGVFCAERLFGVLCAERLKITGDRKSDAL